MATFTDFKEDFYNKVKDLTIFDCEDFNLLKVVLGGLKVNYAKHPTKKKIFIFKLPLFIDLIIVIYSKLKFKLSGKTAPTSISSTAKILLIDNGGISLLNDESKLTFYTNLMSCKNREDFFVLFNGSKHSAFYSEIHKTNNTHLYDLIIENEKDKYSIKLYLLKYSKLKRSLNKSYYKIKKSNLFDENELYNISYAIDQFFIEYVLTSEILSETKFEKAFITCHYHQEGIIRFLNVKNIELVELQHGLIAKRDIFYVFPKAITKIKDRMMLPNKIFVYGEYWKGILLNGFEHTFDSIKIIGKYQLGGSVSQKAQKDISDLKNCILITTQVGGHKYFIQYLNFLINELNINETYKIVVKIHPSENIEIFKDFFAIKNILVTKDIGVDELHKLCMLQISLFSTTLYDALKYNVVNFSLNAEEWRDYVNDIVEEGISTLLEFNDNPIEKYNEVISLKKTINNEYYYDKFNIDNFKNEL